MSTPPKEYFYTALIGPENNRRRTEGLVWEDSPADAAAKVARKLESSGEAPRCINIYSSANSWARKENALYCS